MRILWAVFSFPIVTALLVIGVQPPPVRAELSEAEREIVRRLHQRESGMVHTLKLWVEHNTGSWNVTGLDSFARLWIDPLEDLGFGVQVVQGRQLDLPVPRPRTGPIVLARRPSPVEGAPTILLSGHVDTVFEADTSFRSFEVGEIDGLARGPGVADMKGGLVVMLEMLRALDRSGDLGRASWVVLLNGDEEIGSMASRPLIEREARRSTWGFVFEAARESGGMVRSRRGLGQFYLVVRGVSAHSGSSHEKGRSAVRELAHKILRVEELTDYTKGITLNVGTVNGGTKRNIVPERAEAWIDVRYDQPEDGERIRKALEAIAAESHFGGTESTLWGTLHRPPKQASDEVDVLLDAHRRVARDLGLLLPSAIHAGGGTDGSLMAGVGLPALDSMGVVGGGAHTTREFVRLDSLSERAALAAVLLRRLVLDFESRLRR